ncbi:MAG: hypothetical protein ABR548_07045 [Actinomycetota bacterium]
MKRRILLGCVAVVGVASGLSLTFWRQCFNQWCRPGAGSVCTLRKPLYVCHYSPQRIAIGLVVAAVAFAIDIVGSQIRASSTKGALLLIVGIAAGVLIAVTRDCYLCYYDFGGRTPLLQACDCFYSRYRIALGSGVLVAFGFAATLLSRGFRRASHALSGA